MVDELTVDGDLGGKTDSGMVEAFGDNTWRTMTAADVLVRLKAAKPAAGDKGEHALRYGEMFAGYEPEAPVQGLVSEPPLWASMLPPLAPLENGSCGLGSQLRFQTVVRGSDSVAAGWSAAIWRTVVARVGAIEK